MSSVHGPTDRQPGDQELNPATLSSALGSDRGSDRKPDWGPEWGPEWEVDLLSQSDPAAHETPPTRGSARYTAILEAAMNQTTAASRTPRSTPSGAPFPGAAGPTGPHATSPADLAQRRARSSARPPTVRRVLLATSAAAGLALAATIAINAVPGASSTAYAAYTPVPTQPSTATAIAQANACAASWDAGIPAGGLTADDVLLAEQRGPASITVVRKGADVALCQDIDPRVPTGWELLSPLAPVPAGAAVLDTISSVGEGQYSYSSAAGQLGEGVTGLEVVLPDGTDVQASTAEGRWVAWWPGPSGGEVDAVRIVVHTSAGQQRFTPTQLFAYPA